MSPISVRKHRMPVNDSGFYGDGRFGGAFVAPELKANLDELADAYYEAMADMIM